MIRGTKVGAHRGAREIPDPWRQLAAGVVHLAIKDAGGQNLRNYRDAHRTVLQAQAQRWLLSADAAAFMQLLDLPHECVLDALTSPTPVKPPRRGKRQYEHHEQSQ